MTTFTHLHCHSCFSLLDGGAPLKDLTRRTAELGMTAVAVTDHNTLGGAVRFFQAARDAGVKPIIGVEFTDVLSTDGSTRGTAYAMSSKVITMGGGVYVAWLDFGA